MNLLLDVARWLASKTLAVLVIAALLTLAALAWSWTGEQRSLRTRVAEVRLEVEAAERDWRSHRVRLLDTERLLHQLEAERPNPLLHPADYLAWKSRFQAAEAAAEAARAARDRAHLLLIEGRARLAGLESRLDDTYHLLVQAALRTWRTIAAAVALFLFGPFLWAAFWFYGLAPLAGRAPPLRLSPPDAPGLCRPLASGKVVEALVEPGRPLVVRMDWLQQYAPGLSKRTRFLLDWKSPFTHYASGLREMTEIRVRDGQPADRVALTSAADPNAYLLALELKDHPGLVLRPGVVVALSGDLHMRARWRWRSLHGWIAGRLRHLLFAGTGTIYVTGHAGIDLIRPDQPVVLEEALVLGADSRSEFATVRTETFWPYFRGRTSLFDYRFSAGQVFLRQTAAPPATRAAVNPFARTLEAILNGLGKLLGL